MQGNDTVDRALQACHFLVGRRTAEDLFGNLKYWVPPFGRIEYLDATEQRSLQGYPVVHSPKLLAALLRLLISRTGQSIQDPSWAEDVDGLTLEQLKSEPFFQVWGEMLTRAAAHAAWHKLDAHLWLLLADLVARLFNADEQVLALLRTHLPDEAPKAEKYMNELLRLKGTDPAQGVRVKDRALRSLLARCDVAVQVQQASLGWPYSSAMQRELLGNRLVWTERPDGLYTFFDLRELFGLMQPRIELDDFVAVQRVVRTACEHAFREHARGRSTPPQAFFIDTFATDELRDKATRAPADEAGDPDDPFAGQVAWLLAMQPRVLQYVAHHLEAFDVRSTVLKRYDFDKAWQKRLKGDDALLDFVADARQVLEILLRWDFLNTLRGFVRTLTVEDGRLVHDGHRLRSSVQPLRLDREDAVHTGRRHGTVVCFDIAGFHQRAAALRQSERFADGDFAALCVQRLLEVRRKVEDWGGRAESFDDGVVVDVFGRALDALRYVATFQGAFERNQSVKPAPFADERANPFAQHLRTGMGSGELLDITVPGRGTAGRIQPLLHPIGEVLGRTRQLVSSELAEVPSGSEEYDPQNLFRVQTVGGQLENRGIAALRRTWKEVAAAVRLEGLDRWTPQGGGAWVAGRRVDLKNYKFDLIFDDPVTGRVVLSRRLGDQPALRGLNPERDGVYEFLFLWPEEFREFIDRAMETEARQPTMDDRGRGIGGGAYGRLRRPAEERSSGSGAYDIPQTSGPVGAPGRVGLGRRRVPPTPAEPPQLNLPGAEDFAASAAGDHSSIDQQLGLQEPDYLSGGRDTGAFDWDTGATRTAEEIAASRPGAPVPTPPEEPSTTRKVPSLPEPGVTATRPVPALPEGAPGSPPDPDPAPAPEGTPAWQPDAPSLLGALDAGYVDRIAAAVREADNERRAARSGALRAQRLRQARSRPRLSPVEGPDPTAAPLPSGDGLGVTAPARRQGRPKPDFGVLFVDYAVFTVPDPERPHDAWAIGRRYRDVLFDLHWMRAPTGVPIWTVEEAVLDFLRRKVRDNFVPRSLSYEPVPEGAGELQPLDVRLLDAAWEEIA
jgi:hypothetical protein